MQKLSSKLPPYGINVSEKRKTREAEELIDWYSEWFDATYTPTISLTKNLIHHWDSK